MNNPIRVLHDWFAKRAHDRHAKASFDSGYEFAKRQIEEAVKHNFDIDITIAMLEAHAAVAERTGSKHHARGVNTAVSHYWYKPS